MNFFTRCFSVVFVVSLVFSPNLLAMKRRRPLSSPGPNELYKSPEKQSPSQENDEKAGEDLSQSEPPLTQLEQSLYTQMFEAEEMTQETRREIYERILNLGTTQEMRASLTKVAALGVQKLIKSRKLVERNKASKVSLSYQVDFEDLAKIEIEDGQTVFVGRKNLVCDLLVPVPSKEKDPAGNTLARSVSNVHLAVMRQNGYVIILDIGSLNGTRVIKFNEENTQIEEHLDPDEKFNQQHSILPETHSARLHCGAAEFWLESVKFRGKKGYKRLRLTSAQAKKEHS